ncbi:hypothetical protein BBAD15_g7849 [Beauveria bassiana D1-5]|uniref:Uncharacterized protein n=1 Tax=Beauveria bassiana D1-5 TaxID=1245745 RepID=A0A0A2VL11_BEABA|nr:hypothetical protein BBAD15_g7849 [Beauveria bassiana D1-5]
MHSSSTTDHASLGRRPRSAAPRLVPAAPAASPTRLILSTTIERMASLVDVKTEKSLKDSPKSSLLASDVHDHCSRNRCRDALCRNTTEWDTKQAAADLGILSPVEIDNKTTAILAPTASTKPQPPSAIARLATYTAGNFGSTTSRKWAEDAIQVSQKNRSRKALTTIELRLDEGSVGRKAQSTVGGSIKRKLVPCPTRSLRLDRSTDNHILPVRVDSRPGCPPVYDSTFPRDPFADEKSFEENLFDGLLCECPTGSSTPKSTTLTLQLHRNGEGDDDRSHHFAIESESLSAQNPDRKIDIDGSCKGKTAIESISGYSRVKKHPSPSKKALEDLELAFAIYTKLKPLEGGDETDELAKDERGALSAADHNKAMRQDRKFAVPEEAHEMAHRRAYRIRHSLPYRPTVKNTQDIDELRC